VNDEGRYVKRPARRASFATGDLPFVGELVAARLLSTFVEQGEDIVEAAHEALFTKWPVLKTILDEDQEFLIGRERLKQDLGDWLSSGKSPSALLRGIKLDRVKNWPDVRVTQLSEDERQFITASIASVEQEERQARWRRRLVVLSSLCVAAFFGVAAYFINIERRHADEQRVRAEAALLTNQSTASLAAGRLIEAIGLARAAMAKTDNADTRSALLQALVMTSPHHERGLSAGDISPVALSWTPDGVVVAGLDGRMATWRLQDKSQGGLAAIQLNTTYDPAKKRAGPVAIAVDANAQLIVVWSDGTVTRGGTSAPASSYQLPFEGGRVAIASIAAARNLVAVAAAGDRVPSVYRDQTPVRLPFERCRTNTDDAGFVASIAVNRSGDILAVGFDDGRVCSVLLGDGKTSVTKLDGAVERLAVSADGRQIAAGTDKGSIALMPADLAARRTTSATTSAPVAWSPDGALLAGGCNNGSICVWRADGAADNGEATLVADLGGTGAPVSTLVWSPDGQRIVTANTRNELAAWSITPGGFVASSQTIVRDEALSRVAVSSDGQAAVGSAAGKVALLGPRTPARFIEPFSASQDSGAIASLAWHPAKSVFAALTEDGQASVVALAAQQSRRTRQFLNLGKLVAARWLSGGDTLAVAGTGMRIVLWSPEKPEPEAARTLAARNVPRSADIQALVEDRPHQRLITTGADGRVLTWALQGPEKVDAMEDAPAANAHDKARSVLVMSPDGSRLFVTGNDGQILVYSTETGRIERRIDGGGRQIDAAALNRDGTRLVTIRPDGRIDMWNISDSDSSRFASVASTATPTDIAFSPSANAWLVTTSAGRLIAFSADPKDWRDRASALSPSR
jgi:WD40 repeat protein